MVIKIFIKVLKNRYFGGLGKHRSYSLATENRAFGNLQAHIFATFATESTNSAERHSFAQNRLLLIQTPHG